MLQVGLLPLLLASLALPLVSPLQHSHPKKPFLRSAIVEVDTVGVIFAGFPSVSLDAMLTVAIAALAAVVLFAVTPMALAVYLMFRLGSVPVEALTDRGLLTVAAILEVSRPLVEVDVESLVVEALLLARLLSS
jgi:hypothetical protein